MPFCPKSSWETRNCPELNSSDPPSVKLPCSRQAGPLPLHNTPLSLVHTYSSPFLFVHPCTLQLDFNSPETIEHIYFDLDTKSLAQGLTIKDTQFIERMDE